MRKEHYTNFGSAYFFYKSAFTHQCQFLSLIRDAQWTILYHSQRALRGCMVTPPGPWTNRNRTEQNIYCIDLNSTVSRHTYFDITKDSYKVTINVGHQLVHPYRLLDIADTTDIFSAKQTQKASLSTISFFQRPIKHNRLMSRGTELGST